MANLTWETLADELRAHDRWGDFEAALSHPKAQQWPQMGAHPVNLMVHCGIPVDNYVPILLRALDELTESAGLEMVVRALTEKNIKVATEPLLKIFNDTYAEEPHFLWAVSNAIYTIAPRDYLQECIRICRERRFGLGRGPLVVHLSRFKKSEDVFQTLLSLLDDEPVRGHALDALKRFGDVRAIPAIERTSVREGDEGIHETHQKKMALKKLNQKKNKNSV